MARLVTRLLVLVVLALAVTALGSAVESAESKKKLVSDEPAKAEKAEKVAAAEADDDAPVYAPDGSLAAPTPKRPLPNLIPELYPDKYPGLRAAPSPVVPAAELETEFNWCAHPTGGCVPSWQQHLPVYLPLCYLHGTLSMVMDRIRHALHGKGVPDVTLSRQNVLDCAGAYGYGQDEGGGGETVDVLEYMRQVGVPDETCNPFTGDLSGKCDAKNVCRNCMMLQNDKEPHCWPVERFVKYKVQDYGFVSGEQAMMSEIRARGPIACGLAVDDDFCFKYAGGVYRDPNNVTDSDHVVEVVGWGEQAQPDGTSLKFWLVRNSWYVRGTYVGHNGFALIERGRNTMRIEERCYFANVDVSELEEHLQGRSVGSMFGLIAPGEAPRTLPEGWFDSRKTKHDFMSAEEVAEEKAEGQATDAWIAQYIAGNPTVEALPTMTANKAPAAEPVAAAGVPTATAAPAGGSSVFESAWFWVSAALLAVVLVLGFQLSAAKRAAAKDGYAPIPEPANAHTI